MLAGKGECGGRTLKFFLATVAVLLTISVTACGTMVKHDYGRIPFISPALLPAQYMSIHPRRTQGRFCWTENDRAGDRLKSAFLDALSKVPHADALILVKIVFARSRCIDVEGTPVQMK